MQTLAFVTDKFYFEFVINSEEDIAYVTKRAFKGVKFNDQSTSMPIDCARFYYKTLTTTAWLTMSNRKVNPNTPLTDKEKQLIADALSVGAIGVTSFFCPPVALGCAILWARDVINRPSKWSVQAGPRVQTPWHLLPQSSGIYYIKSSWTTSSLLSVLLGLTYW